MHVVVVHNKTWLINSIGARLKNYDEYMYTTCSLHGLNLTLSSPKNLIMGDGGLMKHNTLQYIHTAYNLAQQYNSEEWNDI